jgi:uncharacterized membrane protein
MKSSILVRMPAVVLVAALAIPSALAAQAPVKHHRYKLIELGTFGGPSSLINPVGNGGPSVNRAGAVVGSSHTAIPLAPTSNSFVCVAGPNVYHALQWGDNGVVDLGSLRAPDNCSNAAVINDRGEAAGQSENGLFDPLTGVKEIRAVYWKEGKIKNLGTFGGNHSAAFDINNHGQIVGFALNKSPDDFSLYAVFFGGPSSGTQTRAFLWQDGRTRDLGTLGGPDAWAAFINERGQIAGYSYINATPNPTTKVPTVDPFLWTKGGRNDRPRRLWRHVGSRGRPQQPGSGHRIIEPCRRPNH